MNAMAKTLSKILEALQPLQTEQDEIKTDVKEINCKIDIIFNQTFNPYFVYVSNNFYS